jgi:hypothetical protein
MALEPDVRDQGRALLADAKESGRDLAGRASQRARGSVEDTRQRATQDLKSVASALRGSDLSQREESLLAPYVGRVADQVDRAADFLEGHSVEEITRDVNQFARRNPAVFLAGCFAAGLLVARFLKASGGRETESGPGSAHGQPNLDARSTSEIRDPHEDRTDVRGAFGSFGPNQDTR